MVRQPAGGPLFQGQGAWLQGQGQQQGPSQGSWQGQQQRQQGQGQQGQQPGVLPQQPSWQQGQPQGPHRDSRKLGDSQVGRLLLLK